MQVYEALQSLSHTLCVLFVFVMGICASAFAKFIHAVKMNIVGCDNLVKGTLICYIQQSKTYATNYVLRKFQYNEVLLFIKRVQAVYIIDLACECGVP